MQSSEGSATHSEQSTHGPIIDLNTGPQPSEVTAANRIEEVPQQGMLFSPRLSVYHIDAFRHDQHPLRLEMGLKFVREVRQEVQIGMLSKYL